MRFYLIVSRYFFAGKILNCTVMGLGIWLCLSGSGVYAQQNMNNIQFSTPLYAPLVTAVPFVGLSSDPKAGAMGDAGIGMEGDANSTFWNIAKTVFLNPKFVAAVNYNPLYTTLRLPDLYLLSFSATYKFDRQAVSFFGKYMNIGRIDLTDINAEPLQTVKPHEFFIGLGYAVKFSNTWSLGVSAKYIRSSLLPNITSLNTGETFKAGQAFALDVGLNYRKEIGTDKVLQWGIAFSNMGNKISYGTSFASNNVLVTGSNFLPANWGIGFGYKQIFKEIHKLNVALDFNKLLVPARPRNTTDPSFIQKYNSQNVIASWLSSFHDAPNGFKEELMEITVGSGVEYVYNDFLSLRTGGFWQSKYKGDRSFYSVGLGLNYKKMFVFNLSYFVPVSFTTGQNTSPLANTVRVGFVYNFFEKL